MKILVVITGGTIGSTTSGSFTSLDAEKNYALIKEFSKNHSDDISFETVSPYSILSENLTADELNKLIDCVCDNLKKGYQGIIITHGTDTLQYSASALSYCFPNIDIPVVLVSANFPLDNKNSNGHKNFEAAVEFIKARKGNSVFVAYKNKKEDKTNIHYGTRMYTHLENTDEVYSIGDQAFAFYEDGKITLNEGYVQTSCSKQNAKYKFFNETGVMVISSLPGDSFAYDLTEAKAVLIRPYHSGTINTADGCLQKFCEKAKSKNVPVFIMTSGLGAEYESTSAFESFNITPLPLSTFVSQYMKLWIANSNNLDIKEFMKKEIAYEHIK
ncbi:MAG: asparaginase [Ruminococcus sp.]|nr:asparaginase [Ruminococcus sp.]